MKKPSCFIQKKAKREHCPHCDKFFDANHYGYHKKTVRMIGKLNRCIGCEEHPGYKANLSRKTYKKSLPGFDDYNLPGSGNFYGSKTLNVSGI